MTMKINMTILFISITLFISGCCGLAHSSQICCGNLPGKYYRATRVDIKMMGKRPLLSPLVILSDFPFAVVYETFETPFIAVGLTDPRPPEIPEEIKDQSEINKDKEKEEKAPN